MRGVQNLNLPVLPGKTSPIEWVSAALNRSKYQQFIANRREGLEQYLRECIRITELWAGGRDRAIPLISFLDDSDELTRFKAIFNILQDSGQRDACSGYRSSGCTSRKEDMRSYIRAAAHKRKSLGQAQTDPYETLAIIIADGRKLLFEVRSSPSSECIQQDWLGEENYTELSNHSFCNEVVKHVKACQNQDAFTVQFCAGFSRLIRLYPELCNKRDTRSVLLRTTVTTGPQVDVSPRRKSASKLRSTVSAPDGGAEGGCPPSHPSLPVQEYAPAATPRAMFENGDKFNLHAEYFRFGVCTD